MASYLRVTRAVDRVFYRFRRKEVCTTEKDSDNVEKISCTSGVELDGPPEVFSISEVEEIPIGDSGNRSKDKIPSKHKVVRKKPAHDNAVKVLVAGDNNDDNDSARKGIEKHGDANEKAVDDNTANIFAADFGQDGNHSGNTKVDASKTMTKRPDDRKKPAQNAPLDVLSGNAYDDGTHSEKTKDSKYVIEKEETPATRKDVRTNTSYGHALTTLSGYGYGDVDSEHTKDAGQVIQMDEITTDTKGNSLLEVKDVGSDNDLKTANNTPPTEPITNAVVFKDVHLDEKTATFETVDTVENSMSVTHKNSLKEMDKRGENTTFTKEHTEEESERIKSTVSNKHTNAASDKLGDDTKLKDNQTNEVSRKTESLLRRTRKDSLTNATGSVILVNEHTDEASSKAESSVSKKLTDAELERRTGRYASKDVHTDETSKSVKNTASLKHTSSFSEISGNKQLTDERVDEITRQSERTLDTKHTDATTKNIGDVVLNDVHSDETTGEVKDTITRKHTVGRKESLGITEVKNGKYNESSIMLERSSSLKHVTATSAATGSTISKHKPTDETRSKTKTSDDKTQTGKALATFAVLTDFWRRLAGKETPSKSGDTSDDIGGPTTTGGKTKGVFGKGLALVSKFHSGPGKTGQNASTLQHGGISEKSVVNEVAGSNGEQNRSNSGNPEKSCSCEYEYKPSSFLEQVRFYPGLAVAVFSVVVVQYVFNGLAGSGPDGTIFKNSTGDLADKYFTAITPDSWTFGIWGFIYAWQTAWIIFILVNICRQGSKGQAAYKDPPYIPNTVLLIQILISCLNIAWLLTFDREEIEAAFALLIVYGILQLVMLFISVRVLDKSSPKLVGQARTLEIWLVRFLLHNAIGLQMLWVNFATLLNFQMVLIYSGDQKVCSQDAGTAALSILSASVVVFPLVDMVLLDRYTRYLITPYIVVIVALAGSISKNWDSNQTTSIFSAVLISLVCVIFLVKIALTVYRHFTRPRFTTRCVVCQIDESKQG